MDSPKLRPGEAKICTQRNGIKPELCRLIVSINMDVWRFVRLMAVKIHAIRSYQQDGWHEFSISFQLQTRAARQ
jgi:hypothetical protein